MRKVFKVMWAGTLPGIATVAAWKSFPHELNLEAQDINRMHMQVMLDIKSIEEAMRESINLWIQRSKRNATLAKLIACLKELNWNDSAGNHRNLIKIMKHVCKMATYINFDLIRIV